MQVAKGEGIPFHQVVFGVLVVLDLFFRAHVSSMAIGRAVIIAIAIAVLLTGAAWALVGSRHFGGLLATAGLALIALNAPILATVVVLVGLGILARFALRRPGRVNWRAVTLRANQLSLIIAVVIIGSSVAAVGPGQFALDLEQGGTLQPDVAAASSPALPDIYLVLLDGYPRSDFLKSLYNGDNQPFLDQLAARGFDTYPTSHSNYDATALTLTSMFNMAYLDDIPGLEGFRSSQLDGEDTHAGGQGLMRSLLNDNEAYRLARMAGYQTVAVSAGWEQLAIRAADVFIESGNLSDFEQGMLETTSMGEALEDVDPGFLAGQVRDRIMFNLGALKRIAETPSSHPRFVFIHVPAPHYPLVFGPAGEPVDVSLGAWYGYGPDSPSFRKRYAGAVAYLDQLVLAAIDAMPAPGARERVVVLFSDHGSRPDLGGDEQRVSNLMVASTPGHPHLFGPAPTPVNMIRDLLSVYAGANLPRLAEHSYRTADRATLRFREVYVANTVSLAPTGPAFQ